MFVPSLLMKRCATGLWKSLFCLLRVHNADYYMQEAKKLKHKADALVGFLPLFALFLLNILVGKKTGRPFPNKLNFQQHNPNLLCSALLFWPGDTGTAWFLCTIIPTSIWAGSPHHSFSVLSSPFLQLQKCFVIIFEVNLKWYLSTLEMRDIPIGPNKPELVWGVEDVESWLTGLRTWLWETLICRKTSAFCCIWLCVPRARPTARL